MKKIFIFAGLLALALPPPSARAQTAASPVWEGSYEATRLPNEASEEGTRWQLLFKTPLARAQLVDATLELETPSGTENISYRIEGGPGKIWNPEPSAGTTLEFELQIIDQFSGADAAQDITARTPERTFHLFFTPTSVQCLGDGEKWSMDTTDRLHRYRLTIDPDGNGALYVDDHPDPVLTTRGIANKRGLPFLDFGDASNAYAGVARWKSLRWSHGGVFPP